MLKSSRYHPPRTRALTGLVRKIAKTTAILAVLGSSAVWAQQSGKTYTLTLSKTGTGLGHIRGSNAWIENPLFAEADNVRCGEEPLAQGHISHKCSSYQVPEGAVFTLLTYSEAEKGHDFDGWGGDCAERGKDPVCPMVMTGDKSVSASFTKNAFNTVALNVSKIGKGIVFGGGQGEDGAINCGSQCSGSYRQSSEVELSAYPAQGYYFVGWNIPCDAHGMYGYCIFNIHANTSITATFSNQNAVTLNLEKKGWGDIQMDDDNGYRNYHCLERELSDSDSVPVPLGGYPCSISYPQGRRLTLKAKADTEGGYQFSGWSGACAGVAADSCTVTLDANKSVTALFTPAQPASHYTLDVGVHSAAGFSWEDVFVSSLQREINCGPGVHYSVKGIVCNASFAAGAKVSLTAHPPSGSVFSRWSGDCSGTGRVCIVTMDGKKQVDAHFREATGDEGGGEGSGEGDQCLIRHFTEAEKKIIDVFIAYYGRPADVGGLSAWVAELNNRGGDMNYIMRYFGNAPEYINRFGSLNNSELVDNLFEQLYARTADPKGFDFYTAELNAKRRTLASIALTIFEATNEGGRDEAVLNNRRKAAQHYVTAAETWGGGLTEQTLANVLSQVTDSAASVSAACLGFSNALAKR